VQRETKAQMEERLTGVVRRLNTVLDEERDRATKREHELGQKLIDAENDKARLGVELNDARRELAERSSRITELARDGMAKHRVIERYQGLLDKVIVEGFEGS
jgi:hypothetical protein